MEKDNPDCVSTVSIKPEYPPSEYSSEPPPAYIKPQSSAVQVAKIVSVTVILVSFILGCFILASAYVSNNAYCKQLEQELGLLNEVADRLDSAPQPLQPEALIGENPQQKRHIDPLQSSESQKNSKAIDQNRIDDSDENSYSSSTESKSEQDMIPIKFHLPLQLDLDNIAKNLIEQNQNSKMNCIVEKKRAEELVDHQPKNIRLPFGINLTTDPRLEKLSGERMVIVCESGNIQSAQTNTRQNENDDDDSEEEQDTLMIQPGMIPIPHTAFQSHMPQQVFPPQQMVPQQMMPQQIMPQQMRPQMMPQQMRPQMMPPQMRPILPMEALRPPKPSVLETEDIRMPMNPIKTGQVHVQIENLDQSQGESNPNPLIQHIIQQIITRKIMDIQKAQEEEQQQQPTDQQEQTDDQSYNQVQYDRRPIPVSMMAPRYSTSEEALTRLNRLPFPDRVVAVAVAAPDFSEEDSSETEPEKPQVVPMLRSTPPKADEAENRQLYARGMPLNIPVPIMQHIQEQERESQAAAASDTRPHFLQPRSIEPAADAAKSRVVRSISSQKRVKRCSCDCAC